MDFIATVIEDLHRVIVFGEVEKVAPEGFDTSLEVIDEGRAVVGDVTVCDFSYIFTSKTRVSIDFNGKEDVAADKK